MMMVEPNRLKGLRGTLTRDAPLAHHTSWRAGGPADRLYVPADRDDLAAFVRQLPATEPITVIGLGSNVLVRDGGVRGTVILLHDPGAMLAVQDGLVYADAGAACPKLARFAAVHGCADAEFLAGIPGTVGGALAMNAGCQGGETWRHVARVEMLNRDGTFAIRTPDEFLVSYRTVTERDGQAPKGIFTAAWFRFPSGDSALARARIRTLPGDYAARLIEACGLKGLAIGGAEVSTKHANFIVNPERRACAADIEALIAWVRAVVREQTGVDLEPEVRIVGEEG
jgi:UDP-N-acetylmuramate dehydrogenase